MQLATAHLFRAKWTNQIHDEWIAALLRDRSDIPKDRLLHVVDLMNEAVPDALVSGYEHLVDAIKVPDPKDRHVVAAAIHAKCDAIITYNLKDFPAETLARYNLEAIHPDDFINHQINLDEAKVVVAAQKCCSRLTNPPKTGEEYLSALEKQALPKTVAFLRQYVSVFCAFRDTKDEAPAAQVIDLRNRRSKSP